MSGQTNPKVSFIVPVYNVENYLTRSVNSILNQSLSDIEVILVDDGSPDNCPTMCDQYAIEDKRVQVIHQKNGGLSAARNSGLKICRGEYIIFVDSDDYVEPTMADELLRLCEQFDLDFCMCHFFKGKKRLVTDMEQEGAYKIYRGEELLEKWHSVYTHIETPAWAKIYKRTLFEESGELIVKYPEGRLFEDVATTHLLVSRARKAGVLNRALYHYTYNSSGIMHSTYSKKKFDDTIFVQWERFCFFQKNKAKYPNAYDRMYSFFFLSLILSYCSAVREKVNVSGERLSEIRKYVCDNYNDLMASGALSTIEKAAFFCFYRLPGLCVNVFFPVYKFIKR